VSKLLTRVCDLRPPEHQGGSHSMRGVYRAPTVEVYMGHAAAAPHRPMCSVDVLGMWKDGYPVVLLRVIGGAEFQTEVRAALPQPLTPEAVSLGVSCAIIRIAAAHFFRQLAEDPDTGVDWLYEMHDSVAEHYNRQGERAAKRAIRAALGIEAPDAGSED
jgi:hypothetical protein